MKKLLALIMTLAMAMFVMAGCGEENSQDAVSVDSLETIGDIIALEPEGLQTAVYEDKVLYAFTLGDGYYRATASISPEDAKAYFDISYDDEDYEEKQKAIVAPLKIDKMEDLNEQRLSQEDCDALVGKTGKELQDAGWTYSGHDLETMEFWMNYGPFLYTVVFDGETPDGNYEDYDDEKETRDMKVKSVEYNGIGDATNVE